MLFYVLPYLLLLITIFMIFTDLHSLWRIRINKYVLIGISIGLFLYVLGYSILLYNSGSYVDSWLIYITVFTVFIITRIATFIQSRMSGSPKLLWLSITNGIVLTVFMYLLIMAVPIYANDYGLNCSTPRLFGESLLKLGKSFIRGSHFAIMAMTTGGLAQKDGLTKNILEFYYTKGILFCPYYIMFGFVVTIAPLSTITALASLLNDRVSSTLRLYVIANSKKTIFYDSSVENLHIAKCLKNDTDNMRFVFCRSSTDELDQAPDRKTMIREVWGICLPVAETEHKFKGRNFFLICTDNLRNAYEYIKRLKDISEQVEKVLILSNDEKERIQTVTNADQENEWGKKIAVFSFWETMAGQMYNEMNKKTILFILGDEGIQKAFLRKMLEEQKTSNDSDNWKNLRFVIFPHSDREYRNFLLMKDCEYKQIDLTIVTPVGVQGNAYSKLNDYIEKYEPEKERYVVLLYENINTNINLKRYISRQYGNRLENRNLSVFTYCNDPITRNEELKYDKQIPRSSPRAQCDISNMIHYFGVKENLIDEISRQSEWIKIFNS